MEKIKNFVATWKNRGYEKGETQIFWLSFLRDVLNVQNPENFIKFEVPVKLQHTNFIDAFFPDTKVIVEQKSLEKNLLPAYKQAEDYVKGLPLSMHPRYIIACNFQEFLIYDMEKLDAPKKISLDELPKNPQAFNFLIDKEKNKIRLELEISLKAGEIVGKIYDALKSQYINPNSPESLQSLNKLCVRLVFCLYAESSGIFGKKKIFSAYLEGARNIRQDLILLFKTLNTPENLRDPYLADDLKNFPYVNGGLFADEKIEIPNFTQKIKTLLLDEAANFNWSGISPTIFGALFESTLNPITRRAGGMHYTSIENIHKVIDPLFLDDIRAEFISCNKNRKKLLALQNKLASLKFFDPACGSGNFLTETYISLRRLENDILKELLGNQIQLGELTNPVKISISQFFGVEINDFAVSVAKTALWIAELQMLTETQQIIHRNLNFLPLKDFSNIFEGNAVRLDWNEFLPNDINFIMGNPPFVGKTFQSSIQKADIKFFFNNNAVDYVACWYKKTAAFLSARSPSKIRCAFVSTNSITQGEQVTMVFENLGIFIHFAHRTFIWDSESTEKAHVHCVIIGFSNFPSDKKIIFDGKKKFFANHINFYLQDAADFFLHKRSKPLQNFIPPMIFGNMANDGGNLILSEDEKNLLVKKYPDAEKFIKIFLGAEEFLYNKKRYCLWLVDAQPSEIKKIPPIYERVKNVKSFREKSSRAATRKLAEVPQLFGEIRQPKNNFIAIPRVTSENRRYVPIDFLSSEIIASDRIQMIPNADLFLFGILTSSVHMAWMKSFCGRLKSDFNYSATIIYNNFPFPECEERLRQKIEETAGEILAARRAYMFREEGKGSREENSDSLSPKPLALSPNSSLADLYDENLMPKELREAHKKNDRAVMAAYGFDIKMTEEEIVAELVKIYTEKTSGSSV